MQLLLAITVHASTRSVAVFVFIRLRLNMKVCMLCYLATKPDVMQTSHCKVSLIQMYLSYMYIATAR